MLATTKRRLSIWLVVVALLVVGGASAALAEVRTWTDNTGKFTIQAEYVGVEKGQVLLKRDGRIIKVELRRLSGNDQKYVQRLQADKDKTTDPFQGKPAGDSAPKPVKSAIELKVQANGTVVVDDKRLAVDDLRVALRPYRGQQPTVRVSADPDATFKMFAAAILAVGEARLLKFNVRAGRDYPFQLRAPVRRLDVPPPTVQVFADRQGKLDSIRFQGRRFKSADALQSHLSDLVDAKQLLPNVEVQLRCDPKLLFAAVSDVYRAIGERPGTAGTPRPLFARICPVPRSPDELEAVDSVPDLSVPAKPVEVTPPAFDPPPTPLGDAKPPEKRRGRAAPGGASKLASRDPARRQEQLDKYGGTRETEAAVQAALKWIVAHQAADGGWNFDHSGGACNGRCKNAGVLKECRNAATALALLPLLGAGHTHQSGEYRKQVNRGLVFLLGRLKVKRTTQGGTFSERGGTLYSHGLATIAVCEAYEMTGDKRIRGPAQAALNHVVYAQDPVGGGWRYAPRQPGDLSISGWQIASLQMGRFGSLSVPEHTLAKAMNFLDSVQMKGGVGYGYTTPGNKPAMTASGVMSRLNLGWRRDHKGLGEAANHLARIGPSPGNYYFNYLATEALFQFQGEPWNRWNAALQNALLKQQDQAGHQAGSWFTGRDDIGAPRAGRLYCTALAALALESYYRRSPHN